MDQTFLEEKEEQPGFDFKRYFFKLTKNYYWLILSLLVFLAAAFLYMRYTTPLYKVSTMMLINGVQPQADPVAILTSGSITTGGGAPQVRNDATDVNNEMFILQSVALMAQVVDSLKLTYDITTDGRIKDVPVYIDSMPVNIDIKRANPYSLSPLYKFNITATGYTVQDEKKKWNGFYGQPLNVRGDVFMITLKQENTPRGKFKNYGLQLLRRHETVGKHASRLSVLPVQKAGWGMLQISISDELPERGQKIIRTLIENYNTANHDFQNAATRMALDFLNNRVASVNRELNAQENQVRDFKVSNQVYNVSESASQLLTSLGTVDAQKSQNDLKENLLSIVEGTVKNYNGKEEIVINAQGMQDPVLSELITRYNQLVLQKRLILDQSTPNDLRLPSINGQLEEIRNNILKNTDNIRKEIKANEQYLSSQERAYAGRFNTLPAKEKEYVQMNRTLGIKESLYVFLLQKREETNIQAVAADVPKFRIVEDGLNRGIIEPKPQMIYGAAVGLGLLLPALLIFIRFAANKKIETRKDVERATSVPLAGEISFARRNSDAIVTTAGNRSAIAEQFRALRTNLTYLGQGSSHKVLLITSTVSGEGKSFISLNLANSIATSNKKVVLIELDLRKPKLSPKLGLQETTGLTDFLISDLSPREIIQPVEGHDNLYFISSGSLPPNPGELILHQRMPELFNYLRQHYDYIVVDTPPVGVVSDAITLGRLADVSLFIIRHKYSLRASLKLMNDLHASRKLPHLAVLINAIEDNGTDYGYGYSNKYTYEYYTESNALSNGKGKVRRKELQN